MYIATTQAIASETSVTITETCSLDPTASSASCVQTINADGYGQQIARTTAFNITGQYYYQYDVSVTAGANKLKNNGACSAEKSSHSGAASVSPVRGTIVMGAVVLTILGMAVML